MRIDDCQMRVRQSQTDMFARWAFEQLELFSSPFIIGATVELLNIYFKVSLHQISRLQVVLLTGVSLSPCFAHHRQCYGGAGGDTSAEAAQKKSHK